MRDHPLTPMTDANLVRVLQAQSHGAQRRPGRRIGRRRATGAGAAIRARFDALRAEGVAIAIVDAIDNDDLLRLGAARARTCRWSAPAPASRSACRATSASRRRASAAALPPARGLRAIVSGSCSQATNAQVARLPAQRAARRFAIDPLALARARRVVGAALAWAAARGSARAARCSSTHRGARQRSRAAQAALGVRRAPARASSRRSPAIARGLVERGVRQLVVAGGETSGACVQALGVAALRIGAQIDPGVPWCHAPAPTRARRRAAPGAEVGQLRRRDFFSQGLRGAAHDGDTSAAGRARRSAALGRTPVRARLRARHGRQHQRAAATTAS